MIIFLSKLSFISDESRAQALQCPSLVTEGSSVHLQCIATGNPLPNITWIWKGTGDVLGGNEQLILFDVHRNQAGTYQCHAWNGIGNGSISTCRLDVLRKFIDWRILSAYVS